MIWGSAHLIPTRQIVGRFGAISEDNRRVLAMEWLAEGIAHVFFGLRVAISVVTALTAARGQVIWFRICPVVLGSAALLLVLAATVA